MPTPPDAAWESVGALVGELADLAPAERAVRLAALTDPTLRATVSVLLSAYDTGGAMFEHPASAWLADTLEESTDPAERIGERIGAWRLTAQLGQGGMGTVYRAVRDEGGFEQQAAIKMLRPEIAPGIGHDRMRRERQLLARLTHRNIATLLDGGVTPEGRPWFALELVDGEPITRWCARHHLDPLARLQLMRQVCGAVQHAHAALVVHRDLKPGNILVTADGTVKLLDFGIAKLLEVEPGPAQDDPLTRWGAVPATMSYASPEQLDGDDISTASDIYSLGVVLYELLSGQPPFVAGSDLATHRRAVREATPAPLSASVAAASTMGGWSAPRLARWLRGDVERVVQLALRKEPGRRYASADQLSRDLEAVSQGRPVVARADSAPYRLRRLVSRNPIASGLTTVLALSVVVAAGVAIDRARRAEQAGAAATLEAERSARVTDFLAGVLAAPDPWTGERDVSVREVLDAASARAGRDFGDDPRVEALVRLSLAQSYRGLGRFAEAAREFALVASRGDLSLQFDAVRGLAEVTAERGEMAVARSWYDSAMTLAVGAGDSLDMATVHADLAWLHGLNGANDSAHAAAVLAVELRRRHDAVPVELANALNNLAVAELQAGRPDAAVTHLDEAVALMRGAGREGEPPLGAALAVLGGLVSDQGDYARAEVHYRESLVLRRRIFGEGHPDEVGLLVNLAVNALDAGRAHHAVAITDTILLRIAPGGLPGEHPLIGSAMTVRGRALNAVGQPRAALGPLEEALALRRAMLPPAHPALAFTLGALAESHAALGNRREAQAMAAEAHQILLEAFGPEHPRTREAAKRLR